MANPPKGLYNKYRIQKADGSPVDPKAKYFVLRYDEKDAHGQASREALKAYADAIKPIMPELAGDIEKELHDVWINHAISPFSVWREMTTHTGTVFKFDTLEEAEKKYASLVEEAQDRTDILVTTIKAVHLYRNLAAYEWGRGIPLKTYHRASGLVEIHKEYQPDLTH